MIIGQAHPGGIALMHDGGGNRAQTVAALPTIIKTLRARGYRFVTVPELLHQRYLAPPKPKKQTAKKALKQPARKAAAR
jgi:peptidoglycan/xylan/chitin deacetylase (PgdA/CDA1 family)